MIRKNKKKLIILLILFISIGFAYLSTQLSIIGNTIINANKWDIHFENIQVKSGSIEAETPVIDTTKTEVSYSVALQKPGDFYEFTVDAKNSGTIDGKIETITKTNLTTEQLKYLDYKITYDDDSEIAEEDALLKNSKVTYKLRVEYKKDLSSTDLPTTDVANLNLSFEVTYIQRDEVKVVAAKFATGETVSNKMKELSGDIKSIKAFKKANELALNVDMLDASSDDSEEEIDIWFDDTTDTIYWYSDAEKVYLNEDSSWFFENSGSGSDTYESLADVSGLSELDTSLVENLEWFFGDCISLTDLTPIANWDVSNVTSLAYFLVSSTAIENLDALANWDVSNVESLLNTFGLCSSLTDIDGISNWDVAGVTTFENMFQECAFTNLNALSSWDVSSATTLASMFKNNTNLNNISGISSWNVKNITYLTSLFTSCSSLSDLTPLSGWELDNVDNLNWMFASTAVSDLTPIAGWNVSNVSAMACMFTGCNNLTDATCLNSWTLKSGAGTMNMFPSGCTRPSWYTGI